MACVSGMCVATCFGDGDCPAGEVCEPADPNTLNGFDAFFPPDICQPGNGAGNGGNNPPVGGNGGDAPGGEVSCEQGILLPGLGNFQESTMNAPSVLSAECGDGARGPEKVFVYQAEDPTTLVVDTSGSTFDTVLSVRTECAVSNSEIGCDDDGGDGLQSRLSFEVLANTTYFIVVHGFGPDTRGQISLSVSDLGGPDAVCDNACAWANDGTCDDGGPGSLFSVCDIGTDCADCGPR